LDFQATDPTQSSTTMTANACGLFRRLPQKAPVRDAPVRGNDEIGLSSIGEGELKAAEMSDAGNKPAPVASHAEPGSADDNRGEDDESSQGSNNADQSSDVRHGKDISLSSIDQGNKDATDTNEAGKNPPLD
jgi:hypothetical protein